MSMLPVGVALSGGTARSVTHVGVLKALQEEGIPIDYVAATSGGSVVGACYASGMPMSTMVQVANDLGWGSLVSIRLSRLGFVSSKRIENFVQGLIGDVRFEDLDTPLYVVTTDLEDGRKHVFHSGSVATAVRASCCIPQIYLPVEIDGHYYVDGGVSEYLPVATLQEIREMFVIGVSLAQERSVYRRPRNYLQLAIHVMGMVAKTNYIRSKDLADVLVHPTVEDYTPFDFDSSEELIESGYRTTKELIPEIRRRWKQKSSAFHRIIEKITPKNS